MTSVVIDDVGDREEDSMQLKIDTIGAKEKLVEAEAALGTFTDCLIFFISLLR